MRLVYGLISVRGGCQMGSEPKRSTNDSYNSLLTAVFKTMYSKMNAAERLLLRHRFVQRLNIYHSCLSAVLGILTIWHSSLILTVYSVILSVVLVMSITYQNSQNYLERSRALDKCSFQLRQLITDIKAETSFDKSKNAAFYKSYQSIIEDCEHHLQIDYHTAMARERRFKKEPGVTFSKLIYRADVVRYFIIKVILFSAPTLLSLAIVYITQKPRIDNILRTLKQLFYPNI